MGRGRPRAGSAASADGAFRPAERGAWSPRSSATARAHFLAATGLQPRREGGTVRAQASPIVSPFSLRPTSPPTSRTPSLRAGEPGSGTRVPARATRPRTAVHVPAAGAARPQTRSRGPGGGGGCGFLKSRQVLPAKEGAAGRLGGETHASPPAVF